MANLSNINNILRTDSLGVGINRDPLGVLEVSSATRSGIKMFNTGASARTYETYVDASGNYIIYDEDASRNDLVISSGGDATFIGKLTADNFILGGSDDNVFYGMYRAGTETREVRLVSYEPTPNSKVQLGFSNISGSSYTFAPALTVKANLRVGIGTIDPLNILHIKDTGVILRIEDTVQGFIGFIGDANAAGDGVDGDFGIRTANNMTFMVGGSLQKLKITSTGNVEQGLVGTSASGYYYFNATTGGDTGLIFRDNASTNSGFLTYNHSIDAMKFATGGTERMRIDSSGNSTFAGHIAVEDGNNFYGANAIAASSEDGNYVASFGRSTSGSAKFAGNLTVGSGTSTFAGNVTAPTFVGALTGTASQSKKINGISRTAITVGGNANTYYPVALTTGAGSTYMQYSEFVIERGGYDDPGFTGIGFSTLNARFSYKPSGWGYGAVNSSLEMMGQTAQMVANYQDYYHASQMIIWLRGATKYFIWPVVGSTSVVFENTGGTDYVGTYTTFTPTTVVSAIALYTRNFYGSLRTDSNFASGGSITSGGGITSGGVVSVTGGVEVTTGFTATGGTPYLTLKDSFGTGAALAEYKIRVYNGDFEIIDVEASNTTRMRITDIGILVKSGNSTAARIIPETDNAGYIGQSTHRWSAIYAVNGTIQTSDIREKTEIIPTQLGLDFVNDLNPVSYKWIKNERLDASKDKRSHQGLIAQEVAETLEKHGVNKNDFGGLDIQKTDKYDDFHGMSYEQLVVPMIKAIQELKAEIEILKNK